MYLLRLIPAIKIMMSFRYFPLLVMSAAILYSCRSNQPDANAVQQLVGSSIVIPDDLVARADGHDTVWAPRDAAMDARIVVYYDAEGCTPCKLKELLTWKSLIETYDQAEHTRFLFILNAGNTARQELDHIVYSMRFTHPVLIDTAYSFERDNPQLPQEALFHVFLLDRNNRVVLVGSPIGNPQMWELYENTISRLKEREDIGLKTKQNGH